MSSIQRAVHRDTLFDVTKPRRKRARTELSLVEQIRAADLPEPSAEYPFASFLGRNWRFDLAWPEHRLAVEIEGALYGGRVIRVESGYEYRTVRGQKVHVPIDAGTIFRLGGGHNTGERLKRDLEKRAHAAILGWAVISVMPESITHGEVVPLLVLAFQQRGLKVAMPKAAAVPW